MLSNQKVACQNPNFSCEKCKYYTSKKCNYEKHLLTNKHTNSINTIENEEISTKNIYICKNCEKIYKDYSGLWRHKKKCNPINNNSENNTTADNDGCINLNEKTDMCELVKYLMKENSELKNMMLEVMKNGTYNTINTNCNNNNKTFNLQVFLNETCKDAMNIMDFVDSIKLQLTDLESVGQMGYVKGISNIIVKNLKALDVTKRPVHCSDAKREVLYVKDNDKWEKEDPENNKLRKAIKYISHKNILLLSKWRETYPDSQLSDSPQNDKYHHMVMEAMGGEGSTDIEKINKIIRNIAKEVIIEK